MLHLYVAQRLRSYLAATPQRLCFLSDGPQRLNSDIGEKTAETLGELSGS